MKSKLSFKEKLELLDTTLSIFLSIATIIGFILAYQSEFGKIFKELMDQTSIPIEDFKDKYNDFLMFIKYSNEFCRRNEIINLDFLRIDL